MSIKSGDVKLVRSAVMADVPEGGGAPTGSVIPDGASNAIFPDISELDRSGGRVNLRKVVVSVQSDDTDTYLGANVIVAEPPADPRVSVTLFSTKQTFDTRAQAVARIESYKIAGPEFDGYLFENHVQGQRVLQLFQRPGAALPVVGQSLVLVQNEGLANERRQAVMVTEVSSVQRVFTYAGNGAPVDYPAAVVTLGLSDRLRFDFAGSPASRFFARVASATKIRETVVADAGTYAGVVPLVAAAKTGDFSVQASSIYTQLVPSAQTETPLSDIRTNGVSAALVGTGEPITRSLTLGFTSTQAMHTGAPIYPGSLSITRGGVVLTDAGQDLMMGSEQVGTVDHENGIVSLLSNVFGTTAGTHTVQFVPAAVPDLISEQSVYRVTADSVSLNYALTLANAPLPGSVVLSYMAQGRWYLLRDDGSGRLRGIDVSYGAGTVNYVTGALVITLGALPDVGSALLLQSQSDALHQRSSNAALVNGGKLYIPINSDGLLSEEAGSKSITPGSVTLAWKIADVTKTATDDGLGNLTGDASGTVAYAAGVVRISPHVLPPAGTSFLLDITSNERLLASNVLLQNGNLGVTNVRPGSLRFDLPLTAQYSWGNSFIVAAGTVSKPVTVQVFDQAGVLYFRDSDSAGTMRTCGTVNYATGAINISVPAVPASDDMGPIISARGMSGTANYLWNALGAPDKTRSLTLAAVRASIEYATDLPSADALGVQATELRASVKLVPQRVLRGVSFTAGNRLYVQTADNTLMADPSPTLGGGTPAGNVLAAVGQVRVLDWASGASSVVSNWRALQVPPSEGVQAPFCAFQTAFRTAAAPLRSGSLAVRGSMQDGTAFNVNAAGNGKINGARVKGLVDYETGLVQLYFVNPDATSGVTVDLAFLGIEGVGTMFADLALLPSIRYNAVAYSYLPMDAELLGIDPVMLPSDGRVPIFQRGGRAVVGHTGVIEATVSNGQTINCGRVRLSRVRVVGADGAVIHSGYTFDLDAGTVKFVDVSGYAQPVRIEHRIEDMGLMQQVDINGRITFTRQLSHDYPAGSYLASALAAGDLFARVSVVFDQNTYSEAWADTVQGNPATATFNHSAHPITVTNRGAVTERWQLRFTSSTNFSVIGENVGVIAVGDTSTACAPINPATGVPYFTVPWEGFGNGWAAGNVLRFNTIGAELPVWVVRTVQQGAGTVADDKFTLLVRGDVDNPI